jgi:dTDP-4-amino-4,6-dideoxygalactose transaminase
VIPLVKPYISPCEELMPKLESILYSGYIAEGEAVYQFEREFGSYIENPNVISLNSGTAALHIALSLLDIKKGDEVISTALTAEPTNTTIALTGAKIVWADIDIKTGLLNPESVKEKITSKTKAIMLVHYAGMVCDMDAFEKLSSETRIPIIEDAAHALGSKYNGKPIGASSRFTCFSFQAIKHMTTIDGGALTFKNSDNLNEAKKLRWFGLDKNIPRMENNIQRAGFKYHMNNVNATIGSVQLKHIPEIINRHISNGKYFDENLKNINGITLIPYNKNTEPSYWLYTMKVENRKDFIKKMESCGIMASPLHRRNDIHDIFAESNCELPALDCFYNEFIHIPCGWWIDYNTCEMIADNIRKGW